MTPNLLALSICILAFILILDIAACILRFKELISGDATFKIIGSVTIVGLGVFLVIGKYDVTLVASVVGLLGVALGFIFGKSIP